MGCGTSSQHAAAVGPPRPEERLPVNTLSAVIGPNDPPSSSAKSFAGITLNLPVLCRDQFNSKYTNELMHRWRPAEIRYIADDRVVVHYIGWADNFDHWVDLNTDLFKLAPMGLLLPEQCKKGYALDEEQARITDEVFRLGKPFVPPNSTANDSTIGATENNFANESNSSSMATAPPPIEPTESVDVDTTIVIPAIKLPDPPKLAATPAPVIATRRTNTPSTPVDNLSAPAGGSSPPKLAPPPGAQLPQPPQPTATPQQVRLPIPKAPPIDSPPIDIPPENPYCLNDMVRIKYDLVH
jgi:hypothetical protein